MPASPLRTLRLNAVELLRQPGAERRIGVDLTSVDLEIGDERISGDVRVELHVVSNIDGIVVTGEVATPWHAQCRRCLIDVDGVSRAGVDELFQYEATDDDANVISGDQIDLAPTVRDLVLLELPAGPLCSDGCLGICPVCGIDRNRATCSCDTTVRDDRWAALDDLRLDE